MSEQQISKMAGALTEHQQHFGTMPTEDRQWVIQNTKDAITLFAEAVKNRAVKEVKKLLRFIFTFSAEAVDEFVAKKKFVKGETVDGVSIAWLGDNFKADFLGKIEKNVEAVELKIYKLLAAARDLTKEGEPGIIPALNGRHEIMLAHFFQLLAHKQRTKDFTWIIAYICDENGVLGAVGAGWCASIDGWGVCAGSVEDPDRWRAVARVVSR